MQKDGSKISVLARGTAYGFWLEDESGYAIVETAAGFEYATLGIDGALHGTGALVGRATAADVAASRDVRPTRGSGVTKRANSAVSPARTQPMSPGTWPIRSSTSSAGQTSSGSTGSSALSAVGTVKNLVLLLRFSNHGPSGQNRTLPSVANITTIMNAVGGDPVLAPTGSVRDHYLENSYGQVVIDSTVVGWIDVPNTEAYYANGNSGLTNRTWELITAGLQLADPTLDFAQFDQDHDGWIDAITFLHSGYGAEWTGIDQYGTNYLDRMWSHKWEIPVWTSAEGVKVSEYNISPSLWGTSGTEAGHIGVVCHELGHYFGLPDLYDTNGGGGGTGAFCLMGAGAWGFDNTQRHPSHMCAWSKLKLGWLSTSPTLPGPKSLTQAETSASALQIDNGYPPGEALLVENREPVGFDVALNFGGLNVWHVDDTKGRMGTNDVNADEGYNGMSGWPANNKHYRNALAQADGLFELERFVVAGDPGDSFKQSGIHQILGGGQPNTKRYQGGNVIDVGNKLTSIGNAGASMTFTYTQTNGPTITTATLPAALAGSAYSQGIAASGGTAPMTFAETRDDVSYAVSDLGVTTFSSGGVAQGWQQNDGNWALNLPFQFPYYERSYSTLYVDSNGFLDVAPVQPDPDNRRNWLRLATRIAPLWDDLRTDLAGQDIFVDTSTANQITVRWKAESVDSVQPANFAVTLWSDGRIRFDYGSGNVGLTPSVGISRGQSGLLTTVATHDNQATLTNAHSILFTPTGSKIPPGMSLSSAGLLSGTPTVPGTYALKVRATDSLFRYDEKTYTLVVAPDCNGNHVADATDIANATSVDANLDGVPDECTALAFCFGDGSGTACPCGNASAPGTNVGCLNSLALGAKLAASGSARVANDTLVLAGTNMPNSSALYFQGTTKLSGGAGSVFGDGLRCVSGSVVRLGTKANASGGSQYPALGDPNVSVKGLVPVGGGTRHYQVWYRNAASFCASETFNLSNGISVVWIP